MTTNHYIYIAALILPAITVVILFNSPILSELPISYNLAIYPSNLSIAFNVSDSNREQIESLLIKNLGRSIEDVKFSVEGSPKSISYLDTYKSYCAPLDVNLKFIERNISALCKIINEMPCPNESINQSRISNLRSICDKIMVEINESHSENLSTRLLNCPENFKLIESGLANINSNISELNKSIYKWTCQINSSPNISVENSTNIFKNISKIFGNITNSSNQASLFLDRLDPKQNYIFISLIPNSIEKINESETHFASVKIIILNNTQIGSYRAEIILLKDETKTIARIPITIKVAPN